jgi:outer membrane protein assembly factor BamB
MIFRTAALLVMAGLAGCSGLRVPLAAPAEGDWSQDGGGAGRTSATTRALPPPLEPRWRTGVEAGFGPASALVLGEVIAVGTRRGEVVLLSAEDGKRLGRVEVGEAVEGGLARAGEALYAPVEKGRHGVHRLVPETGERQGLVRAGAAASVLVLSGGLAVVATGRSTVGAFGPDDAQPRWTAEVGPGRVLAGTAGNTDVVVAGDDTGSLIALDPGTGAVLWRRALGAPLLERPTVGALLYVPTPRGRLVALDPATGAERWHLALADTTVRFTAPALQDDDVAVAGTDGFVRLLDARTCVERWKTRLDGAITAAPLLAERHVYAGTHRKRLVALDRATGAAVWEDELRGRVRSAFAVGAGCLVVLTDARDVLCYRPVAPATTAADRP